LGNSGTLLRRRRFWHATLTIATYDCVAPYIDIILHYSTSNQTEITHRHCFDIPDNSIKN